MESREIAKLEADLLSFLLVASHRGNAMIFPSVVQAISKLKRGWQERNARSRSQADIDHDIKTDRLTEALYNCGIPLWIAKRNAQAFMCLRPDFDLDASKYRHIKRLLAIHQDEFLNAYFSIGEQHGREAADQWISYIRNNDIFFARIVQLPCDFDTKYLFGG